MGRRWRTDAVAGTAERGIRRKVEGRSEMGGFLLGWGCPDGRRWGWWWPSGGGGGAPCNFRDGRGGTGGAGAPGAVIIQYIYKGLT